MPKILLWSLAAVVLGSFAVPVPAAQSSDFHTCSIGKAHAAALCGSIVVAEDRDRPNGRSIALGVEVMPAIHPQHKAIAVIPGGPGQAASDIAALIADGVLSPELHDLRKTYDLLFVDARGMGSSNPFTCEFTDPRTPQAYFLQLWPDAAVRECREAAQAHSDPAFYNTNNAADDLETVRRALGYERIVLFGGSYGSFFSFDYIRRHPEHVESAVLTGVFAPGFQPLPGAPDGAQHALDDLITRCSADRVCGRHFPKFREHFDAVLARFDRGPVAVRLAQHGTSTMLRLSKEVLVDRVRQVLYDPQNAAYVPVTFELAYKGNYSALADMINGISLALAGAVNGGAFLSYTCADEIPFISPAAMVDAARSSFAGDLRAKAQQRACSLWSVPAMPPSFNEPVRTDIPMLLIMGSDDPATPPKYARRALPYLKNGLAVVVQGAGHITETACTNNLVAKFISNPTGFHIRGSACRTRYTPPPFALSP